MTDKVVLPNSPNRNRLALPWGAERTSRGEASVLGGKQTFLELTDTPDSYQDQKGKWVRVKDDETGLEFNTPSFGITYTVTLVSVILVLFVLAMINSLGTPEPIVIASPTFYNTESTPHIMSIVEPANTNTGQSPNVLDLDIPTQNNSSGTPSVISIGSPDLVSFG